MSEPPTLRGVTFILCEEGLTISVSELPIFK
jgi:hypothetical protein